VSCSPYILTPYVESEFKEPSAVANICAVLCVAKEAVKSARLIILEVFLTSTFEFFNGCKGNIGVGKTTLSQELAKQVLEICIGMMVSY
jgi:hypothetical protein